MPHFEKNDSPSYHDKALTTNPDQLRQVVLILRALNHEIRQRIIDLLVDGDSLTVTDIFIALRVEQSIASQHLAILRKAGIVAFERTGKYIHYTLDRDRLARINILLGQLSA